MQTLLKKHTIRVLLPLTMAESVNWERSEFEVNLTKADIKSSPEFDPEKPINVEYEAQIYDYYGRPFKVNVDKKFSNILPIHLFEGIKNVSCGIKIANNKTYLM